MVMHPYLIKNQAELVNPNNSDHAVALDNYLRSGHRDILLSNIDNPTETYIEPQCVLNFLGLNSEDYEEIDFYSCTDEYCFPEGLMITHYYEVTPNLYIKFLGKYYYIPEYKTIVLMVDSGNKISEEEYLYLGGFTK